MRAWLPVLVLLACVHCGPGQRAVQPQGDPLADTDAAKLYEGARGYAAGGDFVRAEQYLVAAMDKGYPRSEAIPTLIEICIAGSRYDTALHHAKPYLTQNPDNHALRFLVGSLHSAIGQTELALKEWQRVLVETPDNPEVLNAIANLLWKRGQRREAEVYMNRYLEIDPEGSHGSEHRARLKILSESSPMVSPDAGLSELTSSEGEGS